MQATPQTPQLDGSALVSVHTGPQIMFGGTQLWGGMHALSMHRLGAGHESGLHGGLHVLGPVHTLGAGQLAGVQDVPWLPHTYGSPPPPHVPALQVPHWIGSPQPSPAAPHEMPWSLQVSGMQAPKPQA
jgi:hypothetical protein